MVKTNSLSVSGLGIDNNNSWCGIVAPGNGVSLVGGNA